MAILAAGSLFLVCTMWISSPTPARAVCRPEYRKRPTHTACQHPAPWCKVNVSGVEAAERALILKLHNDYRSQVAQGRLPGFPPAADMQELMWDDEMADVAQAHASLCVPPGGPLSHDKLEDRFTTRFDSTGQNLGLQFSSDPVAGPDWKPVVEGWFNEYVDYPVNLVAGFPRRPTPKATGHFTQVVWAKSRYVGCGYAYYVAAGTPLPHMRKYTCNYYDVGNVVTRPVYQSGATCSACPPSTQCDRSTGLCDCQSSQSPHCAGGSSSKQGTSWLWWILTVAVVVFVLGMVGAAAFILRQKYLARSSSAPSDLTAVPQSRCTSELRQSRPTHTLCKPPNHGCNIRNSGVSAADRALILMLHNDYRSRVAQGRLPGFATAADMFKMRWDDDMADVAQAHSNQCTEPGHAVDHDNQLDRSTARFHLTGQNLAWAGRYHSPPTPNWTFVVDSWFSEYQYYSPQDVREFNPYTPQQTKHFTQIIWAKTSYVGCGYVNYSFADPSATPPYMEMYTCNYAPTGNVVNIRSKLPIYEEGPTCSACPPNSPCDPATGLCSGVGHGAKAQQPTRPQEPPIPGDVPNTQPNPKPHPGGSSGGGGGGGSGGGGGGTAGQSGGGPGSDNASVEEDEPPQWLPYIAAMVAAVVTLACCLYFAFARKKKDEQQEQVAPGAMQSQYPTSSTTAL
ncbi:hypothetical protein HPB50_005316 [Hyalomma asiaticum]|uniref:Uncharacterized protein n=1 Tax=Hyalomma asiaticum TaxID=266040 RepID=A0ACB7SF50_HYAAI|nr:hypothetical protein HPB50_005316 [Hyalomma asiaticum]